MCFFGKNVKNIAIKGTNPVGLYRVPRGYIDFSRRERYSKGNLWGGCAEMEEHTGYGCGVIAALDLLLYLARQRETGSAQSASAGGPVPWTLYDRWARQLSRRYMPVVPPVGTNGWAIALGLNAVFLRQGIPLRASWGVSRDRLWTRMGELLDRDVPVILSIGRNFPRVWRNVETAFYTPGRESGPPACSTNAHFVTVTAMDEDYLTVSSWGHPYRLSREEFDAYRREASASLLCTILDVREK